MLFPKLNEFDISSIGMTVNECKVEQSVFSIGGIKAPGPDGFPAIFFQ